MIQHLNLNAQNEPKALQVLAAKDVLYSSNAWWSQLLYVASVFPIVVQGLKLWRPALAEWENVVNFIGLFAVLGIDHLLKKRFEQATRLAEEFDTDLYGLPWNEVQHGAKVASEDRQRLSMQKKDVNYYKNWYSPESLATIPRNLAILICQRQNTKWDQQQKQRFAHFLNFFFFGALAVTFGLGFFWPGLTFIGWFSTMLFPAAGFLVKTYTLQRAYREVANKQDTLATDLDAALAEFHATAQIPADERLRRFQDRIFDYRKENTIVPGWLYRMFRIADQQVATQAGEELIKKIKINSLK